MCEPSTLHRAAPVLPTHVCTHFEKRRRSHVCGGGKTLDGSRYCERCKL